MFVAWHTRDKFVSYVAPVNALGVLVFENVWENRPIFKKQIHCKCMEVSDLKFIELTLVGEYFCPHHQIS